MEEVAILNMFVMKQSISICVFFILLSCPLAVLGQGGGNGNQMLTSILGYALDAVAKVVMDGQQGPYRPSCVPFKLPNGYKNIQDYCKTLSIADDSYWDEVYANASDPVQGQPFPLKGCIAGCIVGKNAFARAARWNAGTWSGKCIRGSTVTNLLSPAIIGSSVVDVYNWTNFLPVIEQFPGKHMFIRNWLE